MDPFSIALLITSLVGLGTGIAQGEEQKQAVRRNRRDQRDAQRQAQNQAAGQQRREDQDRKRANRRGPDISALLAGQTDLSGIAGTLLTGAGGVDNSNLRLGGNPLLGA